MKLWILGSGSSGNAILIECDGSRMLVDCGFGTRILAARLQSIGVDPRSIDCCLVTHEHYDHVKGAGAASKRWGWRVYATAGTARARAFIKTATKVHTFRPGATLDFQRMTVTTTAIPHDANEPVGFVITSKSTGARAGLFYDLGHVSRAIVDACRSLDILVLESNHDDDMLRNGSYPPWLKARIASRVGHLSNREAGAFVRSTVTREVSHVVLAHLSEENNAPKVALACMRAALARTRFRGTLTAARQDVVVGPFTPSGPRAEQPLQYSLF